MEYALDKALKEMSLEDDKPIILKNHPKFSSCERNGCSIIGKLLCPENQKLSSLIHEMPRLWRVNNRARGIALPNDKFQFIFDSENDLSMVLEAGAWTFNDWSMTLERWVENPPADYLKVLPIWIRLRNIPVNFNTADTAREIAEHIGQVTHVAFDPLKPQSRGFVRVRILFDVSKPLKNSRELQLPTGEVVDIGIEYERIRRRCYHCKRLTHDKERCPLNPSHRQGIATGGSQAVTIIPSRLIPKIISGQRQQLMVSNSSPGKAMNRLSQPLQSISDSYVSATQHDFGATVFKPSFSAGSSGTKSREVKKRRRPNKWRRKANAVKEGTGTSQTSPIKDVEESVLSKRKAADEAIESSKLAKRVEEKVAPNEELPKQI
ncbi:unnamed protein product [Arabidopsis arenosa]|uniref:DUF4283 domain-containing protein n=1 Tax=Arabidopsis arenosa TaxID=38785 RepID=A0A8S2ACR6_ARAAE|nr:unnamed protein product [Arabidopsis arenosa]